MTKLSALALCAPLLLAGCPKNKRAPRADSKPNATRVSSGSSVAASAVKKPAATPSSRPTPAQTERPTLRVRMWRFDRVDDGALPVGMRGKVGRWGVATPYDEKPRASVGKVLAQTAQSGSSVFNVLLVTTADEQDLALTVRMRARSGKVDQGGGLIWRAVDHDNYYIARYNPLEDNFRLYTVRKGRREQLASARVKLDHRAWHTLRVSMRGDHIQCFLDGKLTLDKHDSTFAASGKVGLWTKADARSEFDDLSLRNLPRR